MNPILIQLGPVIIRWYGVMMATMILATVLLAYRFGPRFGVSTQVLDRISISFILAAFAGARLGYVISHLAEFTHPIEILRIDHGGLTSHGAIAGGMLLLWWASRRSNVSFWTLTDTVAWVIPLGNIFVRFGNFMNGELYGDVTTLPWAVTFPGVVGARHPLQIYEMIFALIILAMALRVAARRAFEGQLFWTVAVLTSIGRIMLDLFRSEDRIFSVITLGQIPAIILLLSGIWFLATRRTQTRAGIRP